jgi:hypothetical protein
VKEIRFHNSERAF